MATAARLHAPCAMASRGGRPDAAYPRLAGLDSEYLVRQLNAFAEGGRDSETMHPIAKALPPRSVRRLRNSMPGSQRPRSRNLIKLMTTSSQLVLL